MILSLLLILAHGVLIYILLRRSRPNMAEKLLILLNMILLVNQVLHIAAITK